MKRHTTLLLLFLTAEIAIALLHFHKFIRGFIGDVLVIPLLYYFLRLVLKWKTWVLVIFILCFAFIIELLQAFHLNTLLGIESKWLKTILGTTFDPFDIIAYLLGALVILLIEKIIYHEPN